MTNEQAQVTWDGNYEVFVLYPQRAWNDSTNLAGIT